MKNLLLSLALISSTAAMAKDSPLLQSKGWTMQEVSSDLVPTLMVPGSDADGLPERLQGIFWMDGNPNPDELISFANSNWNEEDKTLAIKVYGPDVWSWHNDIAGRGLYELLLATELTYEFKFSDDLTLMDITPVINIAGHRLSPPEFLVKFGSRYINDKLWLRDSAFLGRDVGSYNLRRVIDQNGVRDEKVWADYMKQAPKSAFVIKQVD